ncbi:MAG: isocitrate/isopropylmalate family dehydrogenase [Candidatus Obscuribacterales bacterium]
MGDNCAIFEAGSPRSIAPKYADKDVINPGSVILSGVTMFDFMGWTEAARLIEKGIATSIQKKTVTYDLERLMEGAKKVKTPNYKSSIIENT